MTFIWTDDNYYREIKFGKSVFWLKHKGKRPDAVLYTVNESIRSNVRGQKLITYLKKIKGALI